jgi:hypothetical protein
MRSRLVGSQPAISPKGEVQTIKGISMKKLFAGECSLWVTLWIGYGLPFYIFLMILDSSSAEAGRRTLAYITALFALCWGTAMTVAVWKSADLHTGPPAWKLIAKVLVVFFDIQLLAELVKFF